MSRWMVYDPLEGDATGYATEAEALEAANSLIERSLGDVWADEVDEIVVAKITHVVQRTVLHTRADMTDEQWYEQTADENDCQEWLDYKLVEVES